MKRAAKSGVIVLAVLLVGAWAYCLRELARCREERDILYDQMAAIGSGLDEWRSVVDSVTPLMAERGLEDEADDITTALQAVESEMATRSRRLRPTRRGR